MWPASGSRERRCRRVSRAVGLRGGGGRRSRHARARHPSRLPRGTARGPGTRAVRRPPPRRPGRAAERCDAAGAVSGAPAHGDGRIDQWGTYFDRRPFLWIPWVWAGGGDVLCPDGRRAGGCLDAPVTIEAIRWYTGWMTRQGIAPRTHNLLASVGDDFRLFTSGRVAMMTTGH